MKDKDSTNFRERRKVMKNMLTEEELTKINAGFGKKTDVAPTYKEGTRFYIKGLLGVNLAEVKYTGSYLLSGSSFTLDCKVISVTTAGVLNGYSEGATVWVSEDSLSLIR